MKKIDLIREFKERANLKNMNDAREIIDALGAVIFDHIKDEDGVTPWSGVKFCATYRDARVGRNPKTGEPVNIEAKYKPCVKFGKAAKEAIN